MWSSDCDLRQRRLLPFPLQQSTGLVTIICTPGNCRQLATDRSCCLKWALQASQDKILYLLKLPCPDMLVSTEHSEAYKGTRVTNTLAKLSAQREFIEVPVPLHLNAMREQNPAE